MSFAIPKTYSTKCQYTSSIISPKMVWLLSGACSPGCVWHRTLNSTSFCDQQKGTNMHSNCWPHCVDAIMWDTFGVFACVIVWTSSFFCVCCWTTGQLVRQCTFTLERNEKKQKLRTELLGRSFTQRRTSNKLNTKTASKYVVSKKKTRLDSKSGFLMHYLWCCNLQQLV